MCVRGSFIAKDFYNHPVLCTRGVQSDVTDRKK